MHLLKFVKRAVLTLFIFGGATLTPSVAESAETNGTEPAASVRTSEVVVSATRTERQLFEVPSTVAIINQKTLKEQPKLTVAEQLQDIPGIQVQDQGMGGGAKRIIIRGESPKRVLILIDGMKVSEQKSMDGSMFLIDQNMIERIEVVKGPSSVLYGSEAIGGVINIITKKGGARPVQGTISFTVDSSASSFSPFASIYGKYKGFSYRFSGDFVDADDKRGASGRIDRSDYSTHSSTGYVDYSNDNFKIGAGFDLYKGRINVPLNVSESAGTKATIDLDLPEWKRERYYGLMEVKNISDYLQKISVNAFTSYIEKDFRQKMHIDMPRVQMTPMWGFKQDIKSAISTLNKQRSYGADIQTDWTFGDHYVIAGVDYLRDNLKAYQDRDGNRIVSGSTMPKLPAFGSLQNGIYPTSGNGNFHYKGNQQTFAAFLQDEWSFHEDWKATLGVRGTWVESELTSNNAGLQNGSDSDSNVSFSAGLVYTGIDDLALRAQYSQGYRYPLLNELYIGTPHGSSGVLHPNPNLDAETSQSVEVGARYNAYGIDADLAVYHTWSKDYIYNARIDKTDDTIFDNADKARTFGVELTLAYTIEDWNLTPYVSGAYMHREFETEIYKNSKRKNVTYSNTGDPRWTGRTGIRYEKEVNPKFSWHADAFLRMASHSNQYSSSTEDFQTGGYTTANFAIGAKFGQERNWFIDLNLNNITNKSYTPSQSNIEDPGFNAVVRTGIEF